MMIKRLAKLCALLFASMLAFAVLAEPATASSGSAYYSNGGHLRSTSYFTSNSPRHISSADNYADGWGAYAEWYIPARNVGSTCTNTSGAGTTVRCAIYTDSKLTIQFDACSKDGAISIGCSGTVYETT